MLMLLYGCTYEGLNTGGGSGGQRVSSCRERADSSLRVAAMSVRVAAMSVRVEVVTAVVCQGLV